MALQWLAWRRKAKTRPRTDRAKADRTPRLQLECLEDRTVPSTFAVNTTLDDFISGNGKFSLREAIARANINQGADVIVVPAGVFKTAFGDFDITDAVTIQGAGAGVTVVDGQQIDRVFDVIGSSPSSIKVVFQGLTIRNGKVTGGGGGIQLADADVVVRDCVISGNSASLTGGAISNGSAPGTGNVKVVRTIVGRNVAGGDGGGLLVNGVGSTLTVKDSTVRRNLAGNNGGGIKAGTATLTNCTVRGNSATNDSGGGISAGTATLTNCTVSGNTATNDSGGGILASLANLTNSTVSGNSAAGDGGGIRVLTANLTGSTISGNSASGSGGGIAAVAAANLSNSTVSGNTAGGDGGGIVVFNAATIVNCTIVENIAANGGGLFRDPADAQVVAVRNTLIALNLVGFSGVSPDVSGTFTSLGHNLIGDGSGGAGFVNGVTGNIVGTSTNPIDPKLGALKNNGGNTKTRALLADSPAIDHGDNTGVPATDQRGTGFARRRTATSTASRSWTSARSSGRLQALLFPRGLLP